MRARARARERDNAGARVGDGQREERVRIPSGLCAVSAESDVGLDLTNYESMT